MYNIILYVDVIILFIGPINVSEKRLNGTVRVYCLSIHRMRKNAFLAIYFDVSSTLLRTLKKIHWISRLPLNFTASGTSVLCGPLVF